MAVPRDMRLARQESSHTKRSGESRRLNGRQSCIGVAGMLDKCSLRGYGVKALHQASCVTSQSLFRFRLIVALMEMAVFMH